MLQKIKILIVRKSEVPYRVGTNTFHVVTALNFLGSIKENSERGMYNVPILVYKRKMLCKVCVVSYLNVRDVCSKEFFINGVIYFLCPLSVYSSKCCLSRKMHFYSVFLLLF